MEQIVLIRTFARDVDRDEFRRIVSDAAGCLSLYRLKPIRSYLSADRRQLVCVFEAPDAEAVRTVGGRAPGLVDMRVFPSTLHVPPG